MIRVLEFTVVGLPQPKGSTRAFVPKKWAAQAFAAGRAPRAIVTSDNPKGQGWQQTIANTAAIELHQSKIERFTTGPVVLAIVFYLPRPQTLLTKSKAGIEIPHVKKPDVDKLARLATDALTGVVWTDDSQVTDLIARKRYCAAGEFPRALIRVRAAAPAGGV